MTDANPLEPYDAVLLASYGGPEKPDEIMPFLRRAQRAGTRVVVIDPRRTTTANACRSPSRP